MKSRTVIKKKSIVWYWDKKLGEWHKGKVLAVNRWALTVKKRNGTVFQLSDWAYPASLPKPIVPPKPNRQKEEERKLFWDNGVIKAWGVNARKARFLLKMGIVKFNEQ